MLYAQECPSDWLPNRDILIIAPEAHFEALGVLRTAYEKVGVEVAHFPYENKLPPAATWLTATTGKDAVLLIAPSRRAPRTLTDSPLITRPDGLQIPIGLLMPKHPEELEVFAQAAAKVHLQQKAFPSLALLSQRHPRYKRLGERIEKILAPHRDRIPVFNWSSDLVFQEDMIKGLAGGLGTALYLGHGRPVGWSGYAGLRAHHFTEKEGHPLGSILSLCCLTASRRKVGRSFSESLVLEGHTASCLAAVIPTLHTDNTRWAVRVTQVISEGVKTLGDLINAVQPMKPSALNAYRIIGDPLAPLWAPKAGVQFAKTIKTYA